MDENSIEQTDKDKRWSQMERLVQAGLKKTEWESKKKQTVGAALQGLLSLKDLIGSALETIPQAALAWAGVCFAMQVGLSTGCKGYANVQGICKPDHRDEVKS
jgi:N-terminal domain of NWD NACHT-NTPase